MAKKGSLTVVTTEWAKHLRKDGKRQSNKMERKSGKNLIRKVTSA
jgi:hypothetical protein